MNNITREQIQEIETLLDGIDFEVGEISASRRKITENIEEIKKLLSGAPKEEF